MKLKMKVYTEFSFYITPVLRMHRHFRHTSIRLGPCHGGPDSVAYIYPTYIDHHALTLGVKRYRSRTLRPNTLKRAFGRPCGRSHRPSTGTAAASSSNRARTEQHAPFYRSSIALTRCQVHSKRDTRTHGMHSKRERP